jgi:hypothetical protein
MYALRLVLAFGIAATAGCGRADPHTELRQVIAAAEAAAEERDGGYFRELLSPAYGDARGNDRDALLNLVRGYLLAHSNIEIISTIDEIELQGADAARLVLRAALVGRRAGESRFGGIDGQMYLVELELVNDDSDWRVIGAQWRPASGER